MTVTLAEEIMLLSLDDESGAAKGARPRAGAWRAAFSWSSPWRAGSP